MSIHIVGVTGLPEVQTGDDIARLIRAATSVVDRDTVVVIAQKIVSKAEGAIVDLRSIDPSELEVSGSRASSVIVEPSDEKRTIRLSGVWQ